MTPREIINEAASHGVALFILDGRLRYQGEAQAVAAVLPLLQQHKGALVHELTKTPKTSKTPLPIPEHLESALINHGYTMPEWTPEGCRRFLKQLLAEWPDFHVNGWHGCEFPACWPVALMDAVTSIYVMSIQDEGGAA